MTGLRHDVVHDLEPLRRNHRNSNQALLARIKHASQLAERGRKKPFGTGFFSPDPKSSSVESVMLEKEADSMWPSRTTAPPASKDASNAAAGSAHDLPAYSKCHRTQKLDQMDSSLQGGTGEQATQEELETDKAWTDVYRNLALCLWDRMASPTRPRHEDVSKLLHGLKFVQGRRDLTKKPGFSNTSTIPKISDFSEKAQLKAYLNPEPDDPIVSEISTSPTDSDRSSVPISVESSKRETRTDAGVLNRKSDVPKVVRFSDVSEFSDSWEVKDQRPSPATHHLSHPNLLDTQSKLKVLEKEWSRNELVETTIEVLQHEIEVLLQEKACMLEEIGLLQNQTIPKLKQDGSKLMFENGRTNPELEVTLAFRQSALIRCDFEGKMADARAKSERDSLIVQKAMSRRKAELDAREEALLQRERDLALRGGSATVQSRVSTREEDFVLATERDVAEQERDAISRDLTAWLRQRSGPVPQSDALSQEERQQQSVVRTNAISKDRTLLLRELSVPPKRLDAPTRLKDATSPSVEIEMHEGLRTDRDSSEESTKAYDFQTERKETPSEQQERLATTLSFRALLEPKWRARDGNYIASGVDERPRISKSSGQVVDKLTGSTSKFQHAAFTDHAGTKRNKNSNAGPRKPAVRSQTRPISSARPNVGEDQVDDYNDSDDEDENSDDGNQKRRKRIRSKATSLQRQLACPFSKYDISRYSHSNLTEKRYRGCSKCLFPDISRLKQHLYRVHQRPDNHCIRCFEVFDSDELLDEHAQQRVSCSTGKCPFPEKFTNSQTRELKRKWIGKSAEECWFIIFRILFPRARAPASPYADDIPFPSPDVPQMLRQIVIERLRQHQNPLTLPWLSDEVQVLLGQTVEDSMTELLRRLTPSTTFNPRPSSSISDAHVSNYASGEHASDDNDSDDNASDENVSDDHSPDVQGTGSGQVIDDHSRAIKHGFQEGTALPTSSKESFPNLTASAFDSKYVNLDVGENGIFNGSFGQHDDYRDEQFYPASNGISSLPQQPSSQREAPCHHKSNSLPHFYTTSAPDITSNGFCLHRSQDAWSITSTPFVAPVVPGTASNSMGPFSSAHAGCCDQQVPQKAFEPSIRSFDSGYKSMRSQAGSRRSPNWPTEIIPIPGPGLYDTIAESWGPRDAEEADLCEEAKKPSHISFFAESRTNHHPAATY